MEFTISDTYINWELFNDLFSYDKIHKLIKTFVESIDPEIEVTMSDDEFYCHIDEKIINVPFMSDPESDRLMYDFVLDKFGVAINPYLLGILHEVFHIITYEEDLDDERSIIYYMLQLNFREERYEEYSRMYFSIPSEFAATEGAVNYYLTHKEFCDNFVKQLEKGECQE